MQPRNILSRMATPRGEPPACLRSPDEDLALIAAAAQADATAQAAKLAASGERKAAAAAILPAPPPPRNAPDVLVRFVNLVAPEYQLAPHLVLTFMATESNFDASAVSPKNAQGQGPSQLGVYSVGIVLTENQVAFVMSDGAMQFSAREFRNSRGPADVLLGALLLGTPTLVLVGAIGALP